MKTADILFLCMNFFTIYSASVQKSSRSAVDDENFTNKLDKNCPNISKIIRVDNLESYTINCKTLDKEIFEINQEYILQQACFLVKSILQFMEVTKLDTTSDFFKPKNGSVCPFDFTHLEQLNFTLIDSNLIKELTNIDHCSKVCCDLYSTKKQCSVLSNFINFLRILNLSTMRKNPVTAKVIKTPKNPELVTNTIHNTEGGLVNSTLEKKMQESEKSDFKEILNKEKVEIVGNIGKEKVKNVTKLLKEGQKIGYPMMKATSQLVQNVKVPIDDKRNEKENPISKADISDLNTFKEGVEIEKPLMKSTPKNTEKTEMPQSISKYENDNDDFVEKDRLNTENEDSNENNIFPMEEKNPGINEALNLQAVENSENKLNLPSSGKEIYSGEGFFQAEDSHFFFYFIMVSSVIVIGYLAFHNKNKILAYALEGSNGRRGRRRPNPARYRKLETNLEEVISSSATNTTTSSVVY